MISPVKSLFLYRVVVDVICAYESGAEYARMVFVAQSLRNAMLAVTTSIVPTKNKMKSFITDNSFAVAVVFIS